MRSTRGSTAPTRPEKARSGPVAVIPSKRNGPKTCRADSPVGPGSFLTSISASTACCVISSAAAAAAMISTSRAASNSLPKTWSPSECVLTRVAIGWVPVTGRAPSSISLVSARSKWVSTSSEVPYPVIRPVLLPHSRRRVRSRGLLRHGLQAQIVPSQLPETTSGRPLS